MRKLAVLALGLALCATVMAGDDTKGKTTVRCVYFSVTQKLDNKEFNYGMMPQTGLSVLVKCPGKQILALDPSSEVTKLTDDKDTDLLKGNTLGKLYLYANNYAKDRSGVVISMSSYGTAPARGATKLTLKGKAVLHVGKDEKKTEEKEVEIKEKESVKIGDFTLKVTSVKGFGGGPQFAISSANPAIKSVALKDGDGNAVALQPGFSTNSFYSQFEKAWVSSYYLAKPAKKLKVTITYYSKVEKETVPMELSMGIGL